MRIAYGDGGTRVQRSNTTTGTSVDINLNTSSRTSGGSYNQTANTSSNALGTHNIFIAGRVGLGYSFGFTCYSGSSTATSRYTQTIGGTTSRYSSGTSSYSDVPLNYWSIGGGSTYGLFSYNIRVSNTMLNTSGQDIYPHFIATGGWTTSNGTAYTGSVVGRVNTFFSALTKIRIKPWGGSVGDFTVDNWSYEWLTMDPTGNDQ